MKGLPINSISFFVIIMNLILFFMEVGTGPFNHILMGFAFIVMDFIINFVQNMFTRRKG